MRILLLFSSFFLLFTAGCDNSGNSPDDHAAEVEPDDVVYTNDDQDHFSDKVSETAWEIDNENRTAVASVDPAEAEDWLFASLREQFKNFKLTFEFKVSEGHKYITAFVHVKERHETPASKNLYRVSFSDKKMQIGYEDANSDHQYQTGWKSSDAIDWDYNQWHSITIRFVDSVFTVDFDGVEVGVFDDPNSNAVEGFLAFGGNNYFDSGHTGEPTTLHFRNWSVEHLE